MSDSPLDRLKRMTAWESVPCLSSDDLEALLNQFSLTDADDLTPADEDWTPTYNFRAAAAEAWRWKMGRCADAVSTDLDGDRMSANQLFDHCEAMLKKYSGKATVSTSAA